MWHRDDSLGQLGDDPWDVIVIGGGATGMGAAVDAASRGYRTLLLERNDFCQGTSSRSTKLIHGGVRYLRQGNVSLVRESLHERGLLLRNAPSIVHPLEFIIPTASRWQSFYYGLGLKAYDLLAGRLQIRSSKSLAAKEVLAHLPGLKAEGLYGGISYYDAQFDDARLVMALAGALRRLGGHCFNYFPVVDLLREGGRQRGVVARDAETGREYLLKARAVINATGIGSDRIRRLDDPQAAPELQLSQGSHLVLDRSFLPGNSAIIVPHTDDGRVLFLIPWLGSVLLGTTDTPVSEPLSEPVPLPQEVEYLLEHAGRFLSHAPSRSDVRSCFAGLRPLVKANSGKATSQISRDHHVTISDSGLVSIVGGKWTTYRRMGQDAVDAAARTGGLPSRSTLTESLPLPGPPDDDDPSSPPSEERVTYFIREEMARTVEDVLARRSRLLFLNAHAALQAAPAVARVLARELHRDEDWIAAQQEAFAQLAAGYLLNTPAARDGV